jgi:hypothetical protein
MADHLLAELTCDALVMAIQRRQPVAGLIVLGQKARAAAISG